MLHEIILNTIVTVTVAYVMRRLLQLLEKRGLLPRGDDDHDENYRVRVQVLGDCSEEKRIVLVARVPCRGDVVTLVADKFRVLDIELCGGVSEHTAWDAVALVAPTSGLGANTDPNYKEPPAR